MQKFEDSFEATYQSSGKKNSQPAPKKTKIVINVSGTPPLLQRPNMPSSSMSPRNSSGTSSSIQSAASTSTSAGSMGTCARNSSPACSPIRRSTTSQVRAF